MKKLLLVFSAFVTFSFSAYAEQCNLDPIKIAVVDTGFGYNFHGKGAKLCNTGHKDFSGVNAFTEPNFSSVRVPLDIQGHGTNIVGIIESYVRKAHVNYCIVILKFESGYTSYNGLHATVEAFKYATKFKFPYINYSAGGSMPSGDERKAVKDYLDHGGTMIVAAGNSGVNLDDKGNGEYPAQYDKRIIVVGNLLSNGKKAPLSNYGSCVNRWEVGMNVEGYGVVMSGTSQATATATGKIVSQNSCTGVNNGKPRK